MEKILLAAALLSLMIISFFWYKNYSAKTITTNTGEQPTTTEQTITEASPVMDRLTLSWQSLKKLSEYVIEKFSQDDHAEVARIGEVLLKHGMRYVHVIDYALPSQKYTRKIANNEKLDKPSKLR